MLQVKLKVQCSHVSMSLSFDDPTVYVDSRCPNCGWQIIQRGNTFSVHGSNTPSITVKSKEVNA